MSDGAVLAVSIVALLVSTAAFVVTIWTLRRRQR